MRIKERLSLAIHASDAPRLPLASRTVFMPGGAPSPFFFSPATIFASARV